MKIVELYKEFFDTYSEKYGKDNIAVMMQVGDFYEVYGVEDENLCFGNVTKITSTLDIVRSRKNKDHEFVSMDSPLFAGFPIHSCTKHFKKLVDNDYYVIIIDQSKEDSTQRCVSKVLSKGTYIDDLSCDYSNNIACVYYDEQENIGISFLDLSIGSVKAYEVKDVCEYNRFMNAENPSMVYKRSFNGKNGEKPSKFYTLPKYQETILKGYYQNTGFLSAIEYIDLDTKHNARIALVCLLNIAKEQDSEIVKKLSKPLSNDDNEFLNLEDNALFQLNVVSPQYSKGTLFDVINKTCTQQGKRLLKQNMLCPLIKQNALHYRYDMVNQFRNVDITSNLKSLVDIEKYVHRWRLGKISPYELVMLVYCFPTISSIIENVHNNTHYKFEKYNDFLKFHQIIKKTFFFEMLEKFQSLNAIECNIFQKGIKPELDQLQEELDEIILVVESFLNELNMKDKTDKKQAVIKFEKSNDGWYFSTTAKRVESLKKANALRDYDIKAQKSNVKLYHERLNKLYNAHVEKLKEMVDMVKKEFVTILESWENTFGKMMKELVDYIGYVDFFNNGAVLINNYGYVKPQLVECDTSFVKAKNMRHPIIERLDNKTEYVPNDVNLPEDNKPGMLLFGLNGGGKSSYMKAVGLNVVLAQIGYWVPCESFEYSPFHKLFTRISGDDNIMKGLSSFAVEMKELRHILHKSDEKSLVLGDEICKGTEQDSALGIVAASLVTLSCRNKSRFIFATHLHALSENEEINTKVNVYHLSVDCENEDIVYHRKLLPGSGPSSYGLKVAKHLLHDLEVIKLAEKFRPKPRENALKESKYNTKLLVEKCEICGCKSDLDVHHIEFQCQANEFDLVSHGKHKNNQSNLVVLCEHHHNEVHHDKIQINGWKETSNGKMLDWKNVTPKPKVKKCKYDESQLEKIKSFQQSKLPKKVIVMKLKDDHGIQISVGTLNKYWS